MLHYSNVEKRLLPPMYAVEEMFSSSVVSVSMSVCLSVCVSVHPYKFEVKFEHQGHWIRIKVISLKC